MAKMSPALAFVIAFWSIYTGVAVARGDLFWADVSALVVGGLLGLHLCDRDRKASR